MSEANNRTDKGVYAFLALYTLGFLLAVFYPRLEPHEEAPEASAAETAAASTQIKAPLETLQIVDPKSIKVKKTDIKHWKTANGARVLYFHAPEIPMLDLRMVFRAGSSKDGDKPGLAAISSAMIGEGTSSMSVDEIEKGFESVGASFSAGSYRDMGVIELRTLTDDQWMNKALDIFTEVIGSPSFPEESFTRIREQTLVGLEYEKQSPGTLVNKAYFKTIYGDHPYGSPSNGTPESINAITLDQVRDFYDTYYVASNAVIAITGSLDFQSAQQLSERLSRALESGSPADPVAEVAMPASGSVEHISFPSEQTHIMIGLPAVERNNEDYIALYVGNEVLGGGGLNSRLSRIVRDEHGLAYSVYSSFSPMEARGPFTINLQTRNASAEKALSLVMEELERFLAEGPTTEQLEHAKQQIIGSFPLGVASNSSITGYLGAMGFYHLPIDYLDTFTRKVSDVTAERIKAAFKNYVTKDSLTVMTIGPEAIELQDSASGELAATTNSNTDETEAGE